MKNKRKALTTPSNNGEYIYGGRFSKSNQQLKDEFYDESNWHSVRTKTGLDLMEEISEKLMHSKGEPGSQEALKDYSREQLIQCIEELDSQWGFLDYIHSYETDYWGDFVVDLLIDNKITFSEFSKKMPWAGSQGIDLIVERFKSRLKSKHLNLSKQELAEAFFHERFPTDAMYDPQVTHPESSVTEKEQLAELERVLELSYKDIADKKPVNILDELRKKTAK